MNDTGVPASTRKSGMKNHTVEIIVFNVFNDTFDLGYGAGTFPRLIIPMGIEPYPSPCDVLKGITRFWQVKSFNLLSIPIGHFHRENNAFIVKILKIGQRKPGRKTR